MIIRQRKDDCHYETSFEVYTHAGCGGYIPKIIGYGFTQEQADTDALEKYLISN